MERFNIEKILQQATESEKLFRETNPYPRVPKNYKKTLKWFEQSKAEVKESLKISNIQKSTYVTTPGHCSLSTLDQLESIKLKDMYVNMRHLGKYLLCRVVQDPFYITSMITLVEDEDGDVESVWLYNFTTSYDINPADLLPENTVIAIKEPFLKSMVEDKTKCMIRVESPTDVVILNDYNGVSKWVINQNTATFDEFNNCGNRYFVAKDYRKAIKQYSNALKVH